ncbi:sugar transferase [Candidatus Amarolinea dominans]|uniref:sugar transferase n=1 Tax=Candidatus Amarolinea dominans TaxID=3140696 RepID=UPI003134ABE5|nr:sugar transferase [Anaerolineae bacterium]MBK9230508.1 sugar transferase [Anaerolineae bacterium]
MTPALRRRFARLLVVTDVFLINAAFGVAYYLRYELQWLRDLDPSTYRRFDAYLPFALILTLLLLFAYRVDGAYDIRRDSSLVEEAYRITAGTATAIIIMVAIAFFTRPQLNSRLIYVYTGIFIPVFLIVSRIVFRAWLWRLRRRGIGVDRLLIVGAGEVGRMVMRSVVAQPELGYEIIGFLDDDPGKSNTALGRLRGLGTLDSLQDVLKSMPIDEVIVALPWHAHRKIVQVVQEVQQANVRPRIVPDLFALMLGRVQLDQINGIPLIGMQPVAITGFNLAVKRLLDVLVSILALTLAAPFWLLIPIAIKLDSPGPVLFNQVRIGRAGRPFVVHKFRSMVVDAEEQKDSLRSLNEADGPLFKIKEDPRTTRVGRLIRRTSLDELPQFLNVLKGDMSLVGPRPALPEEVAQYEEWHKRRLEASPGITGLWQVSGRSLVGFEEMVLLDTFYCENWSFGLDLKILFKTIPRVILGEGAF